MGRLDGRAAVITGAAGGLLCEVNLTGVPPLG